MKKIVSRTTQPRRGVMLRFSPYFTFTLSSFLYDYLITLVARKHGHTHSSIATHFILISDSFHFLSMTQVLLLGLTHMFMTQHLDI